MTNVRDFGAMGDGLADDTAAIEHALHDGGDGLLEFPRGEYRITRTITFDLSKIGRLAIHGSGGTAKLIMHGAGPGFEFLGHHEGSADPNSFKSDVWQSERMPTISQIEIEGKHPEADGVRFNGIMQPTLTGVLIRKVRHAVHVTRRCRNVLISHCHIYHNTGIGVWLDQVNLHQANIIGSHISYNRLGGIRIEGSEIRNLQITGNDIEYNNYRGFNRPEVADVPTAEIYIDCSQGGTVREGTISSNTIQATYSPNGANIRFIGGPSEHAHLTGMWCISSNLIGSQETNVHLTLAREAAELGRRLPPSARSMVREISNLPASPLTTVHCRANIRSRWLGLKPARIMNIPMILSLKWSTTSTIWILRQIYVTR